MKTAMEIKYMKATIGEEDDCRKNRNEDKYNEYFSYLED